MKILHTADWHLGKRLENFSRLEEQKQVLKEICEIADNQKVDAIIIAGDLYDTFNPPAEATDLFYKTLRTLTKNGRRPVVAIAGNHDSPDRIEAPDPLARACGIIFAGYPHSEVPKFSTEAGLEVINTEPGFVELKLPEQETPLRLILTPYANEYRMKTFLGLDDEEGELRSLLEKKWADLANKYCDNQGINLLVTHLFMIKKGGEVPEEPDDEKPVLHVGGAQAIYTENIPPQIQYTALGHLHRFQTVDNTPSPTVYSSSPLSYSFSEANQQKYVVIIEAEANKDVVYDKVPLQSGKKLLRKKFKNIDEAEHWLKENPDTLLELILVTDNYLTAEIRNRLANAHDGIVTIIPELISAQEETTSTSSIDLNLEMQELFKRYFKHKHAGQEPNEEILELFKEIQAVTSEE
ncbi:exonuclease SbcCD subunit D [Cytophagaceae bacterium ABcell3]|nr:exonuclease SbcCD subunit D [Cytophagaceae bacterium ABcell3]